MQNVLPLARAAPGPRCRTRCGRCPGARRGGRGHGPGYPVRPERRRAFADLPPQFPADAASESVVATDAILTQFEQQGQAPASLIEAVRVQAYDAFLSASHVTMILSVIMVTIAVIVVAVGLPPIRPPQLGDESRRHLGW